MTIVDFIQDKWGDIVAVASLAVGGKFAIEKNKKKVSDRLAAIDEKQNFEITRLNEKVYLLEKRSDRFDSAVRSIEKELSGMTTEIRINSERTKNNQEKTLLQLANITLLQQNQSNLLEQLIKNKIS
jgi:hypothetical protein